MNSASHTPLGGARGGGGSPYTQYVTWHQFGHFAARGTRKYNFWETGGHNCVFVYTVWASLIKPRQN